MNVDTVPSAPSLRCVLVQSAAMPPYFGRGTLLSSADDRLEVEIEGGPPSVDGSFVVEVDRPEGAVRMMANLREVHGQRLTLDVTRLARPEHRSYPRLDGLLTVHYHVVREGEVSPAAWLAGAKATGRGYAPDPYMNLSVTGVQFEDMPRVRAGDTLLMTLQVPGSPEVWRAVGAIARVHRIPVDERDEAVKGTHRIAVHFTDLSDAGAEALLQYSLRIQGEWMGLSEGDDPLDG